MPDGPERFDPDVPTRKPYRPGRRRGFASGGTSFETTRESPSRPSGGRSYVSTATTFVGLTRT